MQVRRTRRHVFMAMLGVATAVTAAVATGGGTASAAVINQNLDCGIGGAQTMKVLGTAPETVASGGTFTVDLDPQAGSADGGDIKNMTYSFQIPYGASLVPGSVQVVGTGSSNTGAVTASSSGSVVQLKVPGPVANGSSFDAPTLRLQLQATGSAGSVLTTKVRQSGAYTLTAVNTLSISCNATTPLAAFTSTSIQNPTTTTASTTTTTLPGQTTTTTAPPVVTSQTWSPVGDCATVQTTSAPQYATSMTIAASGASGGRSGSQGSSNTVSGGAGSQATATFAVSPGETIAAIVGCDGVNGGKFANTATPGGYSAGGGAGRGFTTSGTAGASAGSGGGSSAVCSGSTCKAGTSASPLVVAGGGGGGGVSNCAATASGPGGAAGSGHIIGANDGAGPSGADGVSAKGAGGAGGVNGTGSGANGATSASPGGSEGLGVSVAGGGGGAGYVGGAAGEKAATGCKGAGGGGGGSSWVSSTGSDASFVTASGAAVTVTFTIETPVPTSTTSTTEPTTTTTTVPSCTPDVVPFASVAALVDQQLVDFGGSPSVRSAWITSISDCTRTAEDLIFSLLPANQNANDAKLFRLYHGFFQRVPDPSGYAAFMPALAAGRSPASVAAEFAVSPEFTDKYGTVTNARFVEMLYFNVLGRFADPSGRAFWIRQLDTRTQSRGEVAVEFAESSEGRSLLVRDVDVFRTFLGMRRVVPSQQQFGEIMNPIRFYGIPSAKAASAPIRRSAGYALRFG